MTSEYGMQKWPILTAVGLLFGTWMVFLRSDGPHLRRCGIRLWAQGREYPFSEADVLRRWLVLSRAGSRRVSPG